MANLIIQENGVVRTTPAVHGEEITIQAPCDCSAVEGVQIADVVYPFYDAAGNPLPMGTGLFATGNLIKVLIDTVNVRATIINHAITPSLIGAMKFATGEYVGTGKNGTKNANSLTFDFVPKVVMIHPVTDINGSSSEIMSYGSGLFYAFAIPTDYACIGYFSNTTGGSFSMPLNGWAKLVGNTLSWYVTGTGTTPVNDQLNHIDVTYKYMAIG